jgi:hypothetical protein
MDQAFAIGAVVVAVAVGGTLYALYPKSFAMGGPPTKPELAQPATTTTTAATPQATTTASAGGNSSATSGGNSTTAATQGSATTPQTGTPPAGSLSSPAPSTGGY